MRTTLTAFVPAHKQTNPEHKPGQVVFSPEPGPNTATNPVNPLGFVDQTLGDYIRRKDGINKAFNAVALENSKPTFGMSQNGRTWYLEWHGPAPENLNDAIKQAKLLLENL